MEQVVDLALPEYTQEEKQVRKEEQTPADLCSQGRNHLRLSFFILTL